jgi:excisionase family DNA binding protein
MPPAEQPAPPEVLAWLARHLANAPERSEQWLREVAALYEAGRTQALASEGQDAQEPQHRRTGGWHDDEALTVPEVAAWLRVSRNQVFNLIREKRIRSFTIGRNRRITAAAVREYLAAREADS